MPSFLIQTLGCKLNQLESEAIAEAYLQESYEEFYHKPHEQYEQLREEKREEGREGEEPAIIVINTCTVTSKADQKARRVIRKALRDYPDAKVIVTGCYAQLNKDDILKLEGGGNGRLNVIGKDDILSFINSNPSKSAENRVPFEFNPKNFSSHTRSFLKIQDGCDKHCTYCKIRLARGKSVSLEADEVLKRLRVLEETHAEAVLTGVNISQYFGRREKREEFYHECNQRLLHKPYEQLRGREEERGFNLAELLEFLINGTDKIAIRLSSLAPESVDEKLVKVLAHPRIRPHFHLSVQSCSDKILEKMGRTYNAQTVEKAVELLRGVSCSEVSRAKDNPFLACDIITGFSGETETEFLETYNLLKKLDFAWIHVFPFSKRPGTPAFSFTDNASESEVSRRVEMLTELAKQGRADYVKRWIGKEVDVLVEKRKSFTANRTNCNGVSENYLKVLIRCEGDVPPAGTVVRCKLTEAGDFEKYDAKAAT